MSMEHSFWGVKSEVLFRGYSQEEMFQIHREFDDLIGKWMGRAKRSRRGGALKEVQIIDLTAKPFRDVLR